MSKKKAIKTALIIALFFISLGGWFLHIRVHPLPKESFSLLPISTGIISVVLLPFLFWFKKTLPLAYIINGFIAIIGTIAMSHFSIIHYKGALSLQGLFFQTTFPDIAILWAKFALGYAIFNLEFLKTEGDVLFKGRYLRYPNLGWWFVHLVSLSIIYSIGAIFWK